VRLSCWSRSRHARGRGAGGDSPSSSLRSVPDLPQELVAVTSRLVVHGFACVRVRAFMGDPVASPCVRCCRRRSSQWLALRGRLGGVLDVWTVD
jgi:hypothetical protein